MGIVPRVLLAIFILLVDFLSFFVPLGSLAIAWVILARPRWARDFVAKLYGEDEPTDEGSVAVTPVETGAVEGEGEAEAVARPRE
jgi:hypothetical protein